MSSTVAKEEEEPIEVLIDRIYGIVVFTPLSSRSPAEQALLRDAVRHACTYLNYLEREIIELRYGVRGWRAQGLMNVAQGLQICEANAFSIENEALEKFSNMRPSRLLDSQIDEWRFQLGLMCRR